MEVIKMRNHFYVIIILFVGTTKGEIRNPLKDPYICGRPQCAELGNNFRYEVNHLYKYDYSMYVKTEFAGSGQNTSELHLTAGVEINFPRKCEGVLRFYAVELREEALPVVSENDDDYIEQPEIEYHEKNDIVSEELQKYDLKFSFHDGIISELCPNAEEPVWVLNLKKGVLSSFQNTMPRFDIDYNTTETDVSGICDVSYSLTGAKDTTLLIHKTKDIHSCRNRYKTHSTLQTTPYDFRQNYAAWPVLKSECYCNISIDHYLYKEVSCFEHHLLVPFSHKATGAVTETLSKLILSDEEILDASDEDLEEINVRSTLLYDHTPSFRQTHNEIKASRELLQKMCKLGFPDIQRTFPDVFINFLSTSRLLSYTALQQLLSRAGSICNNGKNHVLESLQYIGSSASVMIMKDQIINSQISFEQALSWMESLSYLTRPDDSVIDSMYQLVEYGKDKEEHIFTLAASAVTHTYCKLYPDCRSNEHVLQITTFLEQCLEEDIETEVTRKLKNRILVTMKGLGNIGIISNTLEHTLEQIIENDKIAVEIRLQAVNTFRKFDCNKKREYFLRIYSDFHENSEVRISSYLQAMRCPDYLSIKVIKNILKGEEINQVGSFVWSHLNNLAKSASPVRVETQGLLMDNDLGRKFKMDIRKFSRNYEHSLFFDEYNFGSIIEGNLIFGTDSYLPRSTNFNFTIDLFGESVNFLEFTARAEGFEKNVEDLFGTNGPLGFNSLKENYESLAKLWRETGAEESKQNLLKLRDKRDTMEEDDLYENDSDELLRAKRDTSNYNTLKEKIDNINYKMNYKFNEPKASLGIKIFGNDLKMYSIEGVHEVLEALDKMNPMKNLRKFLSGKEITYSKSGIFLDTSYVVPLSSGMPLSVSVLGASSIDCRLSGNLRAADIKIRDAFKADIDVEGNIKSSISLDIIASMQSDFIHTGTGIKVKSNLYSNSAINAKLVIRDYKFASLQFSLPQERNEIFSVKSELLVIRENNEMTQRGIAKRYTNSTCTWPVIDQAIGLKLCSMYSLPDVSNSTTTYPSLILSGPISLNISLDKADPTAKTFQFLYKLDYETEHAISKASFIFETPGSQIPRVFTALISQDPTGYNLTMFFKNGDNMHSAAAIHRKSAFNKTLDISFNANNQKYLSLEMGYNVTEMKNGYRIHPSFFLSVNNERIAGLGGTIKYYTKREKEQIDMILQFETKRLQARLSGYMGETEASIIMNHVLDYKFFESNQESIEFKTELANRSFKSRLDYKGSVLLKSSAYPHLDFASKGSFQSALGHMELKIEFNNAPELNWSNTKYITTITLVFAKLHVESSKELRTTASIALTRPRTRTDYKFMIKHKRIKKNGSGHDILLLGRYAPQKEVTAFVSVHLPRKQLFAIDTAVNITVPSFDSLILNFKINEKIRKEYDFDINGVWFSGHSIIMKGIYQDRSSFIKSYHRLKLEAESPSFEDFNADLKYIRDEYEFKFEVTADHSNQPYGIIIRNVDESPTESNAYIEVKWREKLYWISTIIKTTDAKQLYLDIHIDKLRDINIILRGFSSDAKREIGIEVKWDANRDPTQKLAITAEFNAPWHRTYNGGFLVSYPDRTFSGSFTLKGVAPDYLGNARIAWSSTEAIELKLNAGSNTEDLRNFWLIAKLITPFEGWKHNAFNGGFYYLDNLLKTNASIYWAENQQLGFEIMGFYRLTDPEFSCEAKTKLISTVQNVPTIKLYLKHKHDNRRIDTDVLVNHTITNATVSSISQIFSVKSSWTHDADKNFKNLSGSVILRSPFESYSRGALVTKISLSENKQLSGAADLEVLDKRYTMMVEGHIRKIIDNMLEVNITTPIEKFRNIKGRFGISDKEKHIVAEVRAPTGALGAEILFSVITSSNFDVKFHLATPLEGFQKIMLIGKKKPDNIDFRGGWNKIILGIIGVWRKDSLQNFEYSYRVYTPLEKFEDNGFVAKLIKYENHLDTEFSLKFASKKLGLKMSGKPKSQLWRGLKVVDIFDDFLSEENFRSSSSEEDDADKDDEYDYDDYEPMNFLGYIEIDSILWPTVKGNLDFEEVRDSYYAYGQLNLPQGAIELKDKFQFPDYLNSKNTLKIKTPFLFMKEITSNIENTIVLNKQYVVSTYVNILNNVTWINLGYRINYTTIFDESEIHEATIDLITPLENLPKIKLEGSIEIEENTYRGNLTATTLTTFISVAGSLETDENYTDTSMAVMLRAPLVPNYYCRLFYKEDSSEIENILGFGFEVVHNTTNNFIVDLSWQTDKPHYLLGNGKLITNLLPLSKVDSAILITKSPHPIASFELAYMDSKGASDEIKMRASRNREIVSFDLSIPIQEFRNVSAYGILENTDVENTFKVSGSMYKNSQTFNADGEITLLGDIPRKIDLLFKPVSSGDSCNILYNLYTNNNNINVDMKLSRKEEFAEITGVFKNEKNINWYLELDASTSSIENNKAHLTVSKTLMDNDDVIRKLEMLTPWESISKINIETLARVNAKTGITKLKYNLPAISGSSACSWSWMIRENLQILIENSVSTAIYNKYFKTGLRYTTPSKKRFNIGGDLNVDNIWVFSGNGSMSLVSMEDMGASMIVKLPKPVGDVHKINGKYRAISKPNTDINVDLSYEAEENEKTYAMRGHYRNSTDLQGFGRFEWGANTKTQSVETNVQVLRKKTKKEVSVRMSTPLYTEDTLQAQGSYDINDIYHIISGKMFIPASEQVADSNIAFSSLSNMKGSINTTTPFLNITWLRSDFDFSMDTIDTRTEYMKYLKVSWPNDTAVFDAKSSFVTNDMDRDQQGTIKVEIPLQTRHFTLISYGLKERKAITTGHADIEYNKKTVLNAQYTSKYESRPKFDKETVDIILKNDFKPIGVHYVHTNKKQGEGYEELNTKRAEIFEIRNSDKFNITGEVQYVVRETGQEYIITAIHPNRTVILSSNYDYKDNTTRQMTKLQLATNVWLAYHLKLQNLTNGENESQLFSIELSYPKRNLTAEGWYAVNERLLDSDIQLKYTPNKDEDNEEVDPKTVRASIKWSDEPNNGIDKANQTFSLTLGHPTFEKNITFNGIYLRDSLKLLKLNMVVDYANDSDHLLTFGTDFNDLTDLVGYKNYSFNVHALHEVSELDLLARGSLGIRPWLYGTDANAHYKRGYLSLYEGHMIGLIDLLNKEFKYESINRESALKLYTKYKGNYPIYNVNASIEETPDTNTVGILYIDLDDKLIRLDVNMTPDASHNLQMHGTIPDARSAYFDFWRDYDDIRVIDVAYYLKMNHSRLITSQLIWRPNLRSDVKENVENFIATVYGKITENIVFWVRNTLTESVGMVEHVWREAKPFAGGFINDLDGLTVIQDDLDDLRIFLNNSYNADDFYVRSVVNFTITVLDELAIKNHIASVPKILTEIWQVMGESGQALKKSIEWLLETIKSSYEKSVEVISKILHGDSWTQLSDLMGKAVEKYDKFIKDIHLSFIKYIQNLWNNMTEIMRAYWTRLLKNIEPSIIKLVHYSEALAWNLSKELFEFLYKRTNDLVESPYFNQVSNFTQDLDRLYKDMVGKDAITNFKKYSVLLWKFAKEKYFKIVPFGKEGYDLMTELWEEIKTLQKLEYVQFVIQKFNEVQEKIIWLADEFQVESRIHQLWIILRNKLARFAQTALQADNRYREAKTKFIFDPDNGILELEQKLPMSWHSFNETPKFEEIPEYKIITDVQNFFAGSNVTLWTLYYEYEPYKDPKMWLPPFKANSLLIGSRHFMTFDRNFVSMDLKSDKLQSNQCSYLLANDFVDKSFSLSLEPTVKEGSKLTRKLSLLSGNEIIEIELSETSIKIGRNVTNALPAKIGDTVIYQKSDVLVVEAFKGGFMLQCNLKFNVCSFDLGGWYFGKTAGVLGSMNNEKQDDFVTVSHRYPKSEEEFINSWSLQGCTEEIKPTNFSQNYLQVSNDLHQLCDSFFNQKQSYLVSCFSNVDTKPFYEMCIDLGLNHPSDNTDTQHPTNKGACTAALAYIDACDLENIPLRVPDVCVHCDLTNGSYIPEGTFIEMNNNTNLPVMADIIFIVEAKPCNHEIITSKSIMSVVNALEDELNARNFTNNRFSVLAFGGDIPFDKPRSIIVNSKVFVAYDKISSHFAHIQTGNGSNNDIFVALSVASKLIFRAGASKIFILLPCSSCDATDMNLDYSSLVQLMLENGIKLHILLDEDFDFDKKRAGKIFFGMDGKTAYTKEDIKELKGDDELMKQVRIPKIKLGICTPLAIETYGSVFSGRKLRPERRNPIKKFSTVFAKRVASNGEPATCQLCECTGHNSGVAYMVCIPCLYPQPTPFTKGEWDYENFNEFDFKDDEADASDFFD